MKIAAIYDIHGNFPALEAVLEAVRAEGVDEMVIGGDVVPGPMPRESMAALFDLPVPVRFIRGNGEQAVIASHRGQALTRVPASFHDVIHWVAGTLGPERIAAFADWPLTEQLEIPGLGDVVFCHATPRDENEIFTRVTPEDQLRPIFEATKADLVVCGHTHMQFDRRVGSVRVVNAGSVGMPFGDPGAYWLLLGPGLVELRHTPYDLDAAAERIASAMYPSVFNVRQPQPESKMIDLFEAAAVK